MKVNDDSRIRIQDPDPLVRGMDPRIRIRPKMSWIRNTGCRIVRRSGIKKTVRRWKKKHPARIHAGGVEAYTLQVQTAVKYLNVWPLLLNLLYDTEKSSVNAGGVEAYTLQVQTAVKYRNVGPLLLNLLTDKSSVNAGITGMPEKSYSGIGISLGCQLCQSGIRVSPVPLVTD